MLSEPLALYGFNLDSFLQTDSADTTRGFSGELLEAVHKKAADSSMMQCIGDRKLSLIDDAS